MKNIYKISFVFIILIIFFIFPQPLKYVSQWIFSWYYQIQTIEEIKDFNEFEKDQTISLLPIAHPPQTPYGTVLAKTLKDVDINLPKYVYVEGDIPAGVLIDKINKTFVIQLFSSPSIEEQYSINGSLFKGAGNGASSVFFNIPIESSIKKGDIVIHVPTGVPVGRVVSRKNDEAKTNAEILAVLSINPLETIFYYINIDDTESAVKEDIEKIINVLEENI